MVWTSSLTRVAAATGVPGAFWGPVSRKVCTCRQDSAADSAAEEGPAGTSWSTNWRGGSYPSGWWSAAQRAPPGTGFLAGVVTDWEAAARPAADAGLRTVQVRTGIVQSPRGGTLRLLFPLFGAGLGGKIGNGRQWLSWIGIDDLTDVYLRALVDPALSGPVNAVAPDPVRNADYTRVLGRVLRRPTVTPVPGFGPRLLLGGEGARELAQASQRVRPDALLTAGHAFRHTRLEPALRHLLGRVPDA